MAADRRVYIQYQPDQLGVRCLQDLQALLAQRVVKMRPVSAQELHVTLIHYGKYPDVLAELRQANPDLREAQYAQALHTFVDHCQAETPRTAALKTRRFAMFGRAANVAVIELVPDAHLRKAHARCLAHLQTMLRSCLGTEPLYFMQDSPNFQHALQFRPHVTLGKSVWLEEGAGLPDARLDRVIGLTRMPFWYEGRHVS